MFSTSTRQALVFSLIIIAPSVLSEPHHEEHRGHRHHGAHSHGHARLDIAQEGKALHVILVSPAANVIGFEHAPVDETQRQALMNGVAHLKDAAGLFQFSPDADCVPVSVTVESPLLESEQDHSDHSDHQEEVHADFTGRYHFECRDPEALHSFRTTLFERFPQMTDVDVQMVSDSGQYAGELSATNVSLTF